MKMLSAASFVGLVMVLMARLGRFDRSGKAADKLSDGAVGPTDFVLGGFTPDNFLCGGRLPLFFVTLA